MSHDHPRHPLILSETVRSSVTIRGAPRAFTFHTLTEEEMQFLANGYSSIDQTFLGIALGASIAIALTLTSVPELGPTTRLVYGVLLAAGLLASLYFGWRSWREHRAIRDLIDHRMRAEPD
jgi:hypothetical protein